MLCCYVGTYVYFLLANWRFGGKLRKTTVYSSSCGEISSSWTRKPVTSLRPSTDAGARLISCNTIISYVSRIGVVNRGKNKNKHNLLSPSNRSNTSRTQRLRIGKGKNNTIIIPSRMK